MRKSFEKKRRGGLRIILGLIFLISGLFFLVNYIGISLAFNVQFLESILTWMSAVGSFVGGIYMLFVSPHKKEF